MKNYENRDVEKKAEKNDEIPFPHLQSWMYKRIPIKKETYSEFLERYKKMHPAEKIAASVLGRLIKWSKIDKSIKKWVIYKLVMFILYKFYRIRNKIKIIGKEKIPKKAAIFIINHIKGIDVVSPFLAVFRKPCGVFTEVGNGFIADFLEKMYGFVCRRGTSSQMIEKMIRSIYKTNSFFAMWPEGTLERQNKVMQGFSGIVKVYATLNSKKNIIPFVPIYMAEANEHSQIVFKVLDPLFIPRDWLKPPEQGGKTPREIIDYLMMMLARVKGQKELAINPVLERRRKMAGKPWK
ncbi:MAG: 1-acyl-sn-glycerol-3-phosphate acyltransferase [Promethearchaeota archaeon]